MAHLYCISLRQRNYFSLILACISLATIMNREPNGQHNQFFWDDKKPWGTKEVPAEHISSINRGFLKKEKYILPLPFCELTAAL